VQCKRANFVCITRVRRCGSGLEGPIGVTHTALSLYHHPGIAVVGFATEEEADEAVKKHGEQVQGRWVSVSNLSTQNRLVTVTAV